MTENEAIQRIINIARLEIGYHEKISNKDLDDKYKNAGSGNFTKYARDLDELGDFYNGKKQGFPYCDVTYDWFHFKAWGEDLALKVLCQPRRSAGAGCLFSAQYYKSCGRWHTDDPQPGDQIFFSYRQGEYSHTGLVECVSPFTITTIEGNTSDMVARRSYNKNDPKIIGYGRPRWELLKDFDGENSISKIYKYKERELFDGCVGEDVKQLQNNLLKLGYELPLYGADGEFGKETLSALKSFQYDNNLETNGIANSNVYEKIDYILLNGKQEANNNVIFKIGDIVNYNKNVHYSHAFSNKPISCKKGKAKITDIYLLGKSTHPYHLIAVKGGGSTVYGWVDEGSFTKE